MRRYIILLIIPIIFIAGCGSSTYSSINRTGSNSYVITRHDDRSYGLWSTSKGSVYRCEAQENGDLNCK